MHVVGSTNDALLNPFQELMEQKDALAVLRDMDILNVEERPCRPAAAEWEAVILGVEGEQCPAERQEDAWMTPRLTTPIVQETKEILPGVPQTTTGGRHPPHSTSTNSIVLFPDDLDLELRCGGSRHYSILR